MSGTSAGPYRRRRWLVIIVCLALVLSSGLSWWLGSKLESPTSRAERAAPPPPTAISAVVERRRLVEQIRATATIRLAGSQTVSYEAGDTGVVAVITAMPLRVGQEVAAGDELFEVSGRLVFAFPGVFPAYRDLLPGAAGPDVQQLQRGLWRLG